MEEEEDAQDSREERMLWVACEQGDLLAVMNFLQGRSLDVNWADEYGWTSLSIACHRGHSAVVELLLRDPRVDPNQQDEAGLTPFDIACSFGRLPVLKLLLRDPRIGPRKPNKNGSTGFSVASESGQLEVMRLLMDLGMEANTFDVDGCSPLWHACRIGNLEVARMILASKEDITTSARSLGGDEGWCDRTAAEIARQEQRIAELTAARYNEVVEDDTYARIAGLVEEYERNPSRLRQQLRKELGWVTTSAEILALVIFACDGLLQLDVGIPAEEQGSGGARRFFNIVTRLHLDLQMLVINRSQHFSENLIAAKDRELGFRELARTLTRGI